MSDGLEGFSVTFQVRVKHAALLEAARKVGGARQLAELCRVPYHRMIQWIGMKEVPNFREPKSPNSRWLDSEWVENFEKTIFNLTHQTLDELWPAEVCTPEFTSSPKSGEFTGGYDLRALADYQSKLLALPSPHESAESSELKELVERRLKSLTGREREILKMRFGIPDGVTHTLEECGKAFGIKSERVRQIEAKAIRKMQHKVRKAGLQDYAGGDE